jgi:hypothetical protein
MGFDLEADPKVKMRYLGEAKRLCATPGRTWQQWVACLEWDLSDRWIDQYNAPYALEKHLRTSWTVWESKGFPKTKPARSTKSGGTQNALFDTFPAAEWPDREPEKGLCAVCGETYPFFHRTSVCGLRGQVTTLPADGPSQPDSPGDRGRDMSSL